MASHPGGQPLEAALKDAKEFLEAKFTPAVQESVGIISRNSRAIENLISASTDQSAPVTFNSLQSYAKVMEAAPAMLSKQLNSLGRKVGDVQSAWQQTKAHLDEAEKALASRQEQFTNDTARIEQDYAEKSRGMSDAKKEHEESAKTYNDALSILKKSEQAFSRIDVERTAKLQGISDELQVAKQECDRLRTQVIDLKEITESFSEKHGGVSDAIKAAAKLQAEDDVREHWQRVEDSYKNALAKAEEMKNEACAQLQNKVDRLQDDIASGLRTTMELEVAKTTIAALKQDIVKIQISCAAEKQAVEDRWARIHANDGQNLLSTMQTRLNTWTEQLDEHFKDIQQQNNQFERSIGLDLQTSQDTMERISDSIDDRLGQHARQLQDVYNNDKASFGNIANNLRDRIDGITGLATDATHGKNIENRANQIVRVQFSDITTRLQRISTMIDAHNRTLDDFDAHHNDKIIELEMHKRAFTEAEHKIEMAKEYANRHGADAEKLRDLEQQLAERRAEQSTTLDELRHIRIEFGIQQGRAQVLEKNITDLQKDRDEWKRRAEKCEQNKRDNDGQKSLIGSFLPSSTSRTSSQALPGTRLTPAFGTFNQSTSALTGGFQTRPSALSHSMSPPKISGVPKLPTPSSRTKRTNIRDTDLWRGQAGSPDESQPTDPASEVPEALVDIAGGPGTQSKESLGKRDRRESEDSHSGEPAPKTPRQVEPTQANQPPRRQGSRGAASLLNVFGPGSQSIRSASTRSVLSKLTKAVTGKIKSSGRDSISSTPVDQRPDVAETVTTATSAESESIGDPAVLTRPPVPSFSAGTAFTTGTAGASIYQPATFTGGGLQQLPARPVFPSSPGATATDLRQAEAEAASILALSTLHLNLYPDDNSQSQEEQVLAEGSNMELEPPVVPGVRTLWSMDSKFASRRDGRIRIYESIRLPPDWNDGLNQQLTLQLTATKSNGDVLYTTLDRCATSEVRPGICAANAIIEKPKTADISVQEDGIHDQCKVCKAKNRLCWYVEFTDRPKDKKSEKGSKKESVREFNVDDDGYRYNLFQRKPKGDDNAGAGTGTGATTR